MSRDSLIAYVTVNQRRWYTTCGVTCTHCLSEITCKKFSLQALSLHLLLPLCCKLFTHHHHHQTTTHTTKPQIVMPIQYHDASYSIGLHRHHALIQVHEHNVTTCSHHIYPSSLEITTTSNTTIPTQIRPNTNHEVSIAHCRHTHPHPHLIRVVHHLLKDVFYIQTRTTQSWLSCHSQQVNYQKHI